MFLLKRRKDGKYWRNRSSYSFRHWPNDGYEGEWVEDPSICKPFSTRVAAKGSRGAHVESPIQKPNDLFERKAWTEYYNNSRKWYSKSNLPARNDAFNKQYELVEVKVSIK